MGRDKSLDEFLGGSDAADEVETEPPTADDGAAASGEAKAVPTADWSPEGAACTTCGAVVERRWRQGEGMVCSDCKEW